MMVKMMMMKISKNGFAGCKTAKQQECPEGESGGKSVKWHLPVRESEMETWVEGSVASWRSAGLVDPGGTSSRMCVRVS
jgi:hypothetical protein